MQSNVPVAEATVDEMVLPDRVQDALGDLVGAAREGLLALSVSVGLGRAVRAVEEEVTELVGRRGAGIGTGVRSVMAMRTVV